MATEQRQAGGYVFLSYASADRERALHIADLLEANGIAVWIDRKSIVGGASWSAEIVRGVKDCAALVILCSASSLASRNVQQEVQLGWESDRPILPVLLERTPLPEAIEYALAGRQWVEILDRTEQIWLTDTLRALARLGIQPKAAPSNRAPPLGPDAPSDRALASPERSAKDNLPVELTSFIGRERELAEIRRLLTTGRLITLTGAGGSGKTRLALRIGHELAEPTPDGVWLVELAPLADAALVPQTVLAALGAREVPNQPAIATLVTLLRPRSVLLILDNCEHLVDACARLAETILRTCPNTQILATSRELLGLPGEIAWRVPSLSFPADAIRPTAAELAGSEAAQLFAQRAQTAYPSFALTDDNAPAVAQIVRRLDGIPLAIELAAARVRGLSAEQIVARLDDRFRLLTGGSRTALRRQQTLRALIDWSYDLLSDDERALLRRLSVFAGGFTLEAAEEVGTNLTLRPAPGAPGAGNQFPLSQRTGGGREGVRFDAPYALDLLLQLVDKSLVVADRQGSEDRYRLLETIRQYAGEKLLETGEAAVVRTRHRDYFATLFRDSDDILLGANQKVWLKRLDVENDNVRAALDWSESHDPAVGLQLAGALWRFWRYRNRYDEGRRWLRTFLDLAPVSDETRRNRGFVLNVLGVLALDQGDRREARARLEEGLSLFRQIGDPRGIHQSSINLTLLYEYAGDGRERFRTLVDESFEAARAAGFVRGIGAALYCRAEVALQDGDTKSARALGAEAIAVLQQAGDRWQIAGPVWLLGRVAQAEGTFSEARSHFEDARAIYREVDDNALAAAVTISLGWLAWTEGDRAGARSLLAESLPHLRDTGSYWFDQALAVLGCMEIQDGQPTRGVRLFAAGARRQETSASEIRVANLLFDLLIGQRGKLFEQARLALDDETLRRAWAEGHAMTPEQAVAYALD
jgi:non-specific serine/threonine protein kinase